MRRLLRSGTEGPGAFLFLTSVGERGPEGSLLDSGLVGIYWNLELDGALVM